VSERERERERETNKQTNKHTNKQRTRTRERWSVVNKKRVRMTFLHTYSIIYCVGVYM
jgi:hypothetical protein